MPGIGSVLACALAVVALTSAAAQTFDPERSEAHFSVRLRFWQQIDGEFAGPQGAVEIIDEGTRRVRVRLESASVVFPGHPKYTEWARGESFFHAERYPHIWFESAPFSTELLTTGGGVRGRLSLRGIQREVMFDVVPAACARPGRDCPVQVRGELDRREFGMDQWRLWVQDRSALTFSIWLRPEAP